MLKINDEAKLVAAMRKLVDDGFDGQDIAVFLSQSGALDDYDGGDLAKHAAYRRACMDKLLKRDAEPNNPLTRLQEAVAIAHQAEAGSRDRGHDTRFYVVALKHDKWEVSTRMPLLGEWYDSNGVRHG